jgi:hypothetical protein
VCDQKVWVGVGFTSIETGRGSKSRGLEVEQTLLVAMRKYFKCAAAHLELYVQTVDMCSGRPKSPAVNARAWLHSA